MGYSMISIHPYHSKDRQGVINITYKTAYMGEDAHGYFDDKYLLALLFGLYYLEFEPKGCFVAINNTSGEVVGYILSSLDTETQKQIFQRRMIPRIAARAFLYTSWRYHRCFRVFLRFMFDTEPPHDRLYLNEYPAHLHINVHPKYHKQGIGTKLVNELEKYLKRRKCKGIHLWTSEKNVKAVPFYFKNGFELLYSSPEGYGLWPDAKDVKSLLFGKRYST